MTGWSEGARLVLGGLLLHLGAEWFVAGASALALALRIPKLLVGLTVVAYGTSAPEVIVGVEAAAAGHGQVALANVLGSNIANIGLILGVAALICPAPVDSRLPRRELPILLASTALIPLSLLDGSVSRWEGAALLLLAVAYTGWMVRAARASSRVGVVAAAADIEGSVAQSGGAPAAPSRWRSAAMICAGLATLLFGGSLFVDGAVSLAHAMGLSERVVGLTIVALGTSLPELMTSVTAARRGHSDLAVGNVVGSNIFNSLLCLGAAALAGTVAAPLSVVGAELVGLAAMTGLAAWLMRSARTISRMEGVVAVAFYAAFLAYTLSTP